MDFFSRRSLIAFLILTASGIRAADNGADLSSNREWTSADGRKLSATYLGMQEAEVYLKLPGGKTVSVPLTKLSAVDQKFLETHPKVYRPGWTGWSGDVTAASSAVAVEEQSNGGNSYVYSTRHFQFDTEVDLGTSLTADLGRLFELTYKLNTLAPLGIQAGPDGGTFRARLCATKDEYRKLGGPDGSVGYYDFKNRRIIAQLAPMGIVEGSSGWRKASSKHSDLSTIVYELTYMLTHDTLHELPPWFSKGYADYLSGIPFAGDAFKVDDREIADAVLDSMARDKMVADRLVPRSTADIGYSTGGGSSEKRERLNPKKLSYRLCSIEKILEMEDSEWRNLKQHRMALGTTMRIHRSAHLLVYYLVQIEGEEGVRKIWAMLDRIRAESAKLEAYQEDWDRYRAEMEEFKEKPGVKRLPDGRIEYPKSLTLPVPPPAEAPPTPEGTRRVAISALLDGEDVSMAAGRIEQALREHFGVPISFDRM